MTRRARRIWPTNLGLALAAIAATLLLAEIVARFGFAAPGYHDAPLQLDSEFGFRGIPNYRETEQDASGEFVFELNAEGWRGSAAETGSPAPARLQLAFFGDSFLVGRGLRLEALLPSRAVAQLAKRGVEAAARNYSAIDYGTAQELAVFRQIVSELNPAAVVLAFYSGNDIVNNESALAGRSDVSAGDYVRPYLEGPEFREPHYLHPVRARLRSASRLFAVLERRALVLAQQPRYAWLRPFPPVQSQAERQQARRAPSEALEVLRQHTDGSPWELGWQRSFGLLRTFAREAEQAGARFLVLVIPLEEQVQTGAKTVAFDWASHRMTGVGLDEILDWNLPERRLAEFFAAEGIDARFLLPALREVAATGVTPFTRDRHLNPRGHDIAARHVVDWWSGEAPPEAPSAGTPFARVPSAEGGAARLDFRTAEHEPNLGDGWIEWRREANGVAGGWRIGPRSLAILPDAGGAAVVRGHAAESVNFPLAIALEVVGEHSKVEQVLAPGPFELRVPRALKPKPTPNGYRVLLVGQHGTLDADVRVQELSFEARTQPARARRH